MYTYMESLRVYDVDMAASPRSRLQRVLQTAVQSVDWTYSIFWQRCPQQGSSTPLYEYKVLERSSIYIGITTLVWSDGYYNGAIKTRKTVEPTEVKTEEEVLQRSQELRELYESLISAESTHQSRRPSATLSPENLTEAEWFYLLSVSFSFRPGFGLPGKAYEKQKHVWLAGADEVDSKISCPRLILAKNAGIRTCVCIPILDGVVELGTIKWVEEDMGFIQDIKSVFSHHSQPVISDHSISTTPSISYQPLLLHPTVPSPNSAPPMGDSHMADDDESELGRLPMPDCEAAEASDHQQLVEQLDVPMGVGAGLQDGVWDNLDQEQGHPLDVVEGISPPHETTQKDGFVYSRTVSTILQSTPSSASTAFLKYSTSTSHHHQRRRLCGSHQLVLKYILFTVPFIHTYSHNPTSNDPAAQEELGGGHVLAERRRREKLNERFVTLRSLVPFVTKMDKASILGDTIEYLKHLREKIQELEERTRRMEAKAKQKKLKDLMDEGDDCPVLSQSKKKKRRIMGDGGERKNAAAQVDVSIIESDALVEIQCLHKEGLLIDLIQMLGKFMIEVIEVQSSMKNGVFSAEMRAKIGRGSAANGRKASIVEVKRAINRIIYA